MDEKDTIILTENQSQMLGRRLDKMVSRNLRLTVFSIISLILTALLGFIVMKPIIMPNEYDNANYYLPPNNMPKYISEMNKSIFKISCTNGDSIYGGTGWAIDLDGDRQEAYVVTNFHVIQNCFSSGKIELVNDEYGLVEGTVYSADGGFWEDSNSLRDLALVKIDLKNTSNKIKGLPIQRTPVGIGQWSMVIGYPGSSNGERLHNHSAGIVTGFNNNEIIMTDAGINHGNSGGPLINSSGEVMGTVFASEDKAEYESIGMAQPLSFHCTVVFSCLETNINTSNSGLPEIYKPLKTGDCLSNTVKNQFNMVNINCSSQKAEIQITQDISKSSDNSCDAVSEIVEGSLRIYCYKKL